LPPHHPRTSNEADQNEKNELYQKTVGSAAVVHQTQDISFYRYSILHGCGIN
jgi:hypothetical protein